MNLIPWRRKRAVEDPICPGAVPTLSDNRGEFSRLLDPFDDDPWDFGEWASLLSEFRLAPRLDLAETDREVTASFELAGVDPGEIAIEVAGNLLTVTGEKRQEREEKKKKGFHYAERQFGQFRRTIELPAGADSDAIKADFKDGVLRIRINKKPGTDTRRIEVKSG